MGVQTHTLVDLTSPIGPARLFKALSVDNLDTIPKAVPELIKNVELVEGTSGAVGCIKQINFREGLPVTYLKTRVDEIDHDNFYLKYTTIEGDVLQDKWEYIVYESKYEATSSGSKYSLIAHFHPKSDYVITEEELGKAKGLFTKIPKAVEEYLLANPEAYA